MSGAHEGGIGGIGFPEPPATEEPVAQRDLLTETLDAMRENGETLKELTAALEKQAAEVAQLRGQVARFEAILPQYNAAFQQMDSRMNALAQHVMRNTRFAAMELATKSRNPQEPLERVVQNAERYFEFINKATPAPETKPLEPGSDVPPAGAVTH